MPIQLPLVQPDWIHVDHTFTKADASVILSAKLMLQATWLSMNEKTWQLSTL